MATNANNALPVTSNPPPGVPWEQIPEYIALTDWVIPAGGRITYRMAPSHDALQWLT